MDCPNCGRPIDAGQAFCGECGARVEVAAAPQPVPEPVAPTQPMPQPPAQTQAPVAPAYDDGAYQQQYAQPQQPYVQPQYQQQPYVQPQYPQPARPKKKTGLIIAIVAVVLVFVVGGVVGGIFLVRGLGTGLPTTSTPTGTDSGSTVPETPEVTDDGYATPEDALAAAYPADWVFKMTSDDGEWMTYWVGPPASEFVDEVVVERMADGSWVVSEAIPLGASDVDGGLTPEDEARDTVAEFLDLIMQDRPLEAQQLCIEPFSNDPASASYSNGDFIGYEIVDVVAQEDMTFWIHTAEEWRWGVDEFEYYVVPTELGYFISEARPY